MEPASALGSPPEHTPEAMAALASLGSPPATALGGLEADVISDVVSSPMLAPEGPETVTILGAPVEHASPNEALISMETVVMGPGSLTRPASAPAKLVVDPHVRESLGVGLARQISFEEPAGDLLSSVAFTSSPPLPAVAPLAVVEGANLTFNLPGKRESVPLSTGALEMVLGPWPEVHVASPQIVYRKRHLLPTSGRKWPTHRAALGLTQDGSPGVPLSLAHSEQTSQVIDGPLALPSAAFLAAAASLSPGEAVPSLGVLLAPQPAAIIGTRPQATPARSKRRIEPYSHTPRRSERLAAINGGRHQHSASKAQRVLMKKLKVVEDESKVEDTDILKYLELFKSPLVPAHVQALAALCNVRLSSPQSVEVC